MNKDDIKLEVSKCLNFTETPNNSAYSHLRRLLTEFGIEMPASVASQIAHEVEERITEIIIQQIIKEND